MCRAMCNGGWEAVGPWQFRLQLKCFPNLLVFLYGGWDEDAISAVSAVSAGQYLQLLRSLEKDKYSMEYGVHRAQSSLMNHDLRRCATEPTNGDPLAAQG